MLCVLALVAILFCLGNFGKGLYEEHLCEIIFTVGPAIQEMLFEDLTDHVQC